MITYAYRGERGQKGPKCDYVIFECSLIVAEAVELVARIVVVTECYDC